MTDREKAFVLNGVRNHLRFCAIAIGLDADDANTHCYNAAVALKVPHALLEETRLEQQLLMQAIMVAIGCRLPDGF